MYHQGLDISPIKFLKNHGFSSKLNIHRCLRTFTSQWGHHTYCTGCTQHTSGGYQSPGSGAVHNLYTVPVSPGLSLQPEHTVHQAKLIKLGQMLSGWRVSKKQPYLWEAGATWGVGRGTDIKQKLLQNTCWSFKIQWHFLIWATCVKVSFLAKFIPWTLPGKFPSWC